VKKQQEELVSSTTEYKIKVVSAKDGGWLIKVSDWYEDYEFGPYRTPEDTIRAHKTIKELW
jgi:hypothetical protein